MTDSFQDQGGVATMSPHPLARWLLSKFVNYHSSPQRQRQQRAARERARRKAGQSHVVEYFHQLDDGYSHLTAQLLSRLCERYDIELRCHLVHAPRGNNAPEPELLSQLSRHDASCIATEYGLDFPSPPSKTNQALDPALVSLATAILAAQDKQGFISCAAEVGQALWNWDGETLRKLAEQRGSASAQQQQASLDAGTARRHELKHYSGAMFYYAGEWYWGVDRLYHLEKRLAELGADRHPGQPLLAPRPALETGPLRDSGKLTLEFYASLRSPYTAIVFDRVMQLAEQTGIRLEVRPVLPMVMRGVAVTREKGLYIFSDAAREAAEAGVDYGHFYDPIGEPVRRCYSLYPWACQQGRATALLGSFLRAAFVQGINTNTQRGLRKVVEAAGLDWTEAQQHLDQPGWEPILEDNRNAMYRVGLWGVPSFRLLDENGQQLLALWGQDRLWLFSRYIQRYLQRRVE